MLYRISVTERGLTGIANIFRSRLSRLDDLLRAGTAPSMTSGRSLKSVARTLSIIWWLTAVSAMKTLPADHAIIFL